MGERVLIIGAGASHATHGLPMAHNVLLKWHSRIREDVPILALAFHAWVGQDWPAESLEVAWTHFDDALNERLDPSAHRRHRDLTSSEVRQMWCLASNAARLEVSEPHYYRRQIMGAQAKQWPPERFLAISAGWELRKLVQEEFAGRTRQEHCGPYWLIKAELAPSAVISFNYDTTFEDVLGTDRWRYWPDDPGPSGLRVVKPHGSVGWTHQITSGPGVVDQHRRLLPNEMGYTQSGLFQNLVLGLRRKIEHTPDEPEPEIRELFLKIMEECTRLLTRAEAIWIVGYSFPEADSSFREVVSTAMSQRTYPPKIAVVNRGDAFSYLSSLSELFGFRATQSCFHGLDAWCNVKHRFCRA